MRLYSSFVLPYIQYGITLWGSAAATSIEKLFIAQKKALKVVLSLPIRTPTTQLINVANVLTIQKLYVYYVGIFMYRYNNRMLPPCFSDYFLVNSHTHRRDTRNSALYQLPLFTTNKAQQSILFQGAKIWATIPTTIHNARSLASFKNQFKRHLLATQRQAG